MKGSRRMSWTVVQSLAVFALLFSTVFPAVSHATLVISQPTLFEYSYTFDGGWRASGTFLGDQSGLYVVNISDITHIPGSPALWAGGNGIRSGGL